MKKYFAGMQMFALIAMVASIVLATFVPAMYYVAAISMVVLAFASFLEPNSEPACPEIFSAEYRAECAPRRAA